MNALTGRMFPALWSAFARANSDTNVRVVVLTGAGRGFCPGVDMGGLSDMSSGGDQSLGSGGASGPAPPSQHVDSLMTPMQIAKPVRTTALPESPPPASDSRL